ncbi:MAG TPA: penicillin acylase family protein [Actinospica sp.]|nr:penicillin acylase family protein [Actinospica sp.]
MSEEESAAVGEPDESNEAAGPAEPVDVPAPEPPRLRKTKAPGPRLRKTKIAALVFTVVLALLVGGGSWYVRHTIEASFPQVAGTLAVSGLQRRVEVDRNAQGVPQVYASTSHDLFFAQGYVQAQDRFWQMDVYRHITAGRLSEMFGKSQLSTDEFIRTMGWYATAQQEYNLLSPDTQASLVAYSAGVNAYMKTHSGAKASVEYAILGLQTSYTPYAWTPVDSIAWLKALAWDLRDNLQDEIDRSLATQTLSVAQIAQLFPSYPASHPDIVNQGAVVNGGFDQNATASAASPAGGSALPAGAVTAMTHLSSLIRDLPTMLSPDVQGVGSNSWVVSGSLTATGEPLLANDPHLSPELPSIWYQMGLHCVTVDAACPYDVAGYTMPGTPGVVIGHTDTVAWGFTNGTEDVTDLVLEKVVGDTYLYHGRQLPLTEHKETINVAGGSPVTITVRETNQGPLVSDADTDLASVGKDAPVTGAAAAGGPDRGTGYAVALRWTALRPGRTMDALFEIDRATDWNSFRGAAKDFAVPSQNMIYADTSGDIGYQTPGEIPIRKNGDGTWPVPGWTDAYDWTGYIPFDELPHELNPKAGFIVTANNPIIAPNDYPYLLSKDFDYGYRANEITQRLKQATSGGKKIDAVGMRAIQADTTNEFAATLVPYLEKAPTASSTDAAKALFNDWNYATPADSAAAAYFYDVYAYLLEDAFESKLPSSVDVDGSDRWFTVVSDLLPNADSSWWTDSKSAPSVSGRDAVLGLAMDQAAQDMTSKYGADPTKWTWGAMHTLTPTNQTLGTGGPGFVKWLLNGKPTPVAGGSAVVDANGFDLKATGFAVDELPSMRMVVDLSDLDDSTWINLTGASGHVDDPNYLDQLPLWQNQQTLPWPFTRGAVLAATKNKLMLEP